MSSRSSVPLATEKSTSYGCGSPMVISSSVSVFFLPKRWMPKSSKEWAGRGAARKVAHKAATHNRLQRLGGGLWSVKILLALSTHSLPKARIANRRPLFRAAAAEASGSRDLLILKQIPESFESMSKYSEQAQSARRKSYRSDMLLSNRAQSQIVALVH